jgi:PPOX class probable F420-dependent enzyme
VRIFPQMSDPTPSRHFVGDVLADPLVRELLDARLVAVLATFDLEVAIHAVPMWYAVAEDAIVLATSSRSRKIRNLERDPRATLVLHDSRPGFEVCGASIAGTVEIAPVAGAPPLVELVHRRYVTAEGAADPAAAAFLASDDVALRFRPASALTWDERESDAAAALRRPGGALPLVPTDPRA